MRDAALLSCAEAEERFAESLDGELEGALARALDSHLRICDECRSTARETAAIHRDLALSSTWRELEGQDPLRAVLAKARWDSARARRRAASLRARPQPTRETPFPWAISIAAAAFLLACLGFLLSGRDTSPSRAASRAGEVFLQVPQIPRPNASARRSVPTAPEEAPATAPSPELREGGPSLLQPGERPSPAVASTPAAPAVEAPAAAPKPTVTFMARLERVEGRVLIGNEPAAAGGTLGPQDRVATEGIDGFAVIAYPDRTRVILGRDTQVSFARGGKTVAVAAGEVEADIAPQSPNEPMIFATAHAEVKVIGTRLRVSESAAGSHVEVEHGRVQVTRRRDGWSIPLAEGHSAIVASGTPLVARRTPVNLLADPGFEANGKGWEGIFNRAMGRNYGGVAVVTNASRAGTASLHLVGESFTNREVRQDFVTAPGDTYEVSGWWKSAAVAGNGVRVSLVWFDTAADLNISESTMGPLVQQSVIREDVVGSLSGTRDWFRLSGRFSAPARAKQVRLLVYMDLDPTAKGMAWVDDLSLRRYGKSR